METDNLRKAQLCLLELLDVFKKICEEEHIQYFLLGGTALGAVRHQGFIPWDDDIDVALFREDYDRFIEIGSKYLPQGMAFRHYSLDENYPNYTMKLVNENVSYVMQKQYTQVRQNVWIDIFPIDGTPNHSWMRTIHYRILDFHRMMIVFHEIKNVRIDPDRALWRKVLIKMVKIIPVGRIINPTRQKKCLDREFRKYSVDRSDYIGNYMGAYHQREIFPKYYFGSGCPVTFEGGSYTAPAETDRYLSQQYGDYMKLPPAEYQVPKHHFVRIDFSNDTE